MKKDNSHERNIEKNCDLCGRPLLVDQYRWGRCEHCGWDNCEAALENPDYPYMGNFLSYNNAKKLYKEGKPLRPNFEEFIEFFRVYGEVQFTHKKKVYGFYRGNPIAMFCVGVNNSTKYYESYDDFRKRAEIDGLLLKDIWNEVEGVNYLE